MIDFAKLAAHFPGVQVSWRVGTLTQDKSSGLALAYLDARDVMDRLDAVCTPGGWQATYPHAGQKTVCSIGILCGDTWVWKSNGAGDSDVEAEKGALSDAFKRAAVLWGIGRYLYDVPKIWGKTKAQGRSYVFTDDELKRFAGILAKLAAGVKPDSDLHPPQPDMIAGTARWVQDQKTLLLNFGSKEEIDTWATGNTAALKKLYKADEPAWHSLKEARDLALDRVRAPL